MKRWVLTHVAITGSRLGLDMVWKPCIIKNKYRFISTTWHSILKPVSRWHVYFIYFRWPSHSNIFNLKTIHIILGASLKNHENEVTWASWWFKLPKTGVFVQQFVQSNIKENIKMLHYWSLLKDTPGGRLNIKMLSYQYRDPHVKDKTVARPSYL